MPLETAAEAWFSRFGTSVPEGADPLAAILRHRSVRAFTKEPISEDAVRLLVGAAQSASTSSHLQCYSLVSIQDPERRKAISLLCGDQSQIVEAAWFFAFVIDLARIRAIAESHGGAAAASNTLEFLLLGAIDASLAAERMVVAADTLGFGTCYIGGLRNEPLEVAKFLGLPDGCLGVFGLCLGVPDAERLPRVKPRLDHDEVWHREHYNSDAGWSGLDERMKDWYRQEGGDPAYTWSQRTGRRGEDKYLGTRLKLRDAAHASNIDQR